GVTVLELQKRCFSSCRKVACDGRSLVISNPPFLVVLPPPLSSRAPSHWLPWPLFPRGSQIRKIGLAEFSTLKIDLRGSCWLFRTMRDLFRWAAFFFVSLLVVRGESIYELSLRDIDGKVTSLAPFKGRVLLIVNVASECGYTAQYQGLESVFAKYQAKGLVVLGFPCNQFGGQEPGSNAEIKTFCSGTFHVTFPLFEKIEVNGAKRHPLYAALTGQGSPFPGNVRWNFNKFLVGRDGTILRRIDSDVEPDSPEMIKAIEAALAAKP
ncbi:MAG: hypothetical protein RL077_4551, partial [Verrucomicrobiota bacterium]